MLFALLLLVQEIDVDYIETVSLIEVPLLVARDGRLISNLRSSDLLVKENGTKVDVVGLELVEMSTTFHFLIDVSASQGRRLDRAKALARDMITSLNEGDRVKISWISSYYRSVTDYSSDLTASMQAVDELVPLGTTALYDGIVSGVKELARENGPRVMVVISDGQDLASHTNEEKVAAVVKNYGLTIFILAFTKPDSSTPLLLEQRQFLEQVTASVDGAVLSAGSSALREITRWRRDHGKRYQLRYVPLDPDDTEQWRRLSVTVPSCSDCQLDYRHAFKIRN